MTFENWYQSMIQRVIDGPADDAKSRDFLFDHKTACREAWEAATEHGAKVKQ